MDNTGQPIQNGSDRPNAQEASIDHYQSIVDRAHQEIEGVRSVYKWLAGSIGIILATAIAAATYLTYGTMDDMRAHLDDQVTYLEKKVETRIDREFDEENVQSLVEQKAKERIDEVADFIIREQLTQILNPKLAEIDGRITSLRRELDNNISETESKLKKLEFEAMTELRETSRYMMTVIAAQTDDRRAFDQLREWAEDQDSPFRVRALAAWQKIVDDHASPFRESGFTVPWKKDVDPSKLGINDLRKSYESAPANVRLTLLEYIWNRNDFPKKEKLRFLVDVLREDQSLKVVEYAGRYFTDVSGQKIKPLVVTRHLEWWDNNKDTVQ